VRLGLGQQSTCGRGWRQWRAPRPGAGQHDDRRRRTDSVLAASGRAKWDLRALPSDFARYSFRRSRCR